MRIEKLARDHGLMNAVTPQRENSMACVSFPTCPLAMAEAERFLPSFIDKVEGLMSKHGVSDEHIVTRVTGCPNGCGRAMLAEVGLVGKAPGRYNLHIGGNRNGTRIPRMYRENITESEILDSLDELVGRWRKSAKRVKASAILRCVRASFARCSTQPAISGNNIHGARWRVAIRASETRRPDERSVVRQNRQTRFICPYSI